jgi:SseB protein N-terminal domain
VSAQGYRRAPARSADVGDRAGPVATVSPVRELSAGDPRFRDDRGGADPAVLAALAGYADGTRSEREVLTALAAARLLVPVVAVAAGDPGTGDPGTGDPGTGDPGTGDPGTGDPGAGSGLAAGPGEAGPGEAARAEKDSEMAVPTIIGRDGRAAMPAFTSLRALQRWQPSARPVPVPAASVWESAVAQSQAVIVDIAGPVPLAIEGFRLHRLASGQAAPFLHEDPDVHAAVAAVAAGQPPGIRLRLGPPPADADLLLELAPADPAARRPVPVGLADAIAADIAASLGSRIRRGIAVRVQPPDPGSGD